MHLGWHSWLLGFGLTLLFELPVALFVLQKLEPKWTRRLLIILFANLVTHPLVWFFFPRLPIGYPDRLTLSETWAFGAEALFYATMTSQPRALRAIVASVSANGTSFGIGWFLVPRIASWFY